jgi:hypothetical protein
MVGPLQAAMPDSQELVDAILSGDHLAAGGGADLWEADSGGFESAVDAVLVVAGGGACVPGGA